MGKRTKSKRPEGRTLTLKEVQGSVEIQLDGRRRLNLSFKGVAAVPKCVQKLWDVDELDLSRNLIRKVPDFAGRFLNVSVLDLHSNYLEQLPSVIGRLQNLQVLNAVNNRLTALPAEVGLLTRLHTLQLGLNLLEALPSSVAALRELRRLGLSDNRFARVPACLARLHRLEAVNLDGNPVLLAGCEREREHELLPVTEKRFLVKESFLCESCRDKCRRRRDAEDGDGRRREDSDYTAVLQKYMDAVKM